MWPTRHKYFPTQYLHLRQIDSKYDQLIHGLLKSSIGSRSLGVSNGGEGADGLLVETVDVTVGEAVEVTASESVVVTNGGANVENVGGMVMHSTGGMKEASSKETVEASRM